MSDAEAFAERIVVSYSGVQFLYAVYKPVELRVCQAFLILDESVRIERGVYGNEGETAAQRVIQYGKAAVCGVHHAYYIHVFRDAEQFVGIQQPHLLPALVAFYKHEQFAEDFAQVAAVDFIYYKEIRAARIGLGFFAEIVKYALSQLKAVCRGAVALYKILVGVALMELYILNSM